ncbi:ATP-binding protein [Candidatus Skiveiella danica]|jgi:adenylate kinase|uniref:ATP-binding protein n=1 Tax=Candidatus Skiveiella danica TaxID=3386177 RepID=UPI0039B952F5
MNIFVAGIHGVGKTYLANQLPAGIGLLHTSASQLIKEELALPEWNADKRVADVDKNQVALTKAVARCNALGTALLLDGHFVLLNTAGEFVLLGAEVFKTLNLSAVLLIEADPKVVANRVQSRDGLRRDTEWLATFMRAERAQAEAVCSELSVPIRILVSPSVTEVVAAIASLNP